MKGKIWLIMSVDWPLFWPLILRKAFINLFLNLLLFLSFSIDFEAYKATFLFPTNCHKNLCVCNSKSVRCNTVNDSIFFMLKASKVMTYFERDKQLSIEKALIFQRKVLCNIVVSATFFNENYYSWLDEVDSDAMGLPIGPIW